MFEMFVFQCENEKCTIFFTPSDIMKKGIVMGTDALHVMCPNCGKELLVSKFEDWPVAIHGELPEYEEQK